MQEINNLSPLNQVYINNLNKQQTNSSKVDMTQKPDTFEINGKTKTLSKKKKVLIGAAILAAAAAVTAVIIKRKNVSKAANEAADEIKELILKQNEVNINKGVVKYNNKPFTGIIEDSITGNKPFKYHLEYENGVLIKSIKTQGDDVLEKTYKTLEDGSRKITTNANGSISEKTFNKGKLKEAISNSEKQYKNLSLDTEKLSAEEFSKKSQEIQFLNKNQKADLEKIHTEKIAQEQKAAQIAQEEAQKAANEAQELAQKETQKAERLQVKLNNAADGIIDNFSEEQLCEFKEFLNKNAETIEYNNEIIRHATTPENAEIIKNKGYDISHKTRNNGSNNFGGMDVEALSIGDFGNRYGNAKLEYEFSGKTLKLSNKASEEFKQLVMQSEDAVTQDSVLMKVMDATLKDPELSSGGNIYNTIMRNLLRKFGYDAIAVAPQGKPLFLTILDPNNTKGLKYVRTFNV